jgi:hypothetical protein
MKKVGDLATIAIGAYVSVQGEIVRILTDGYAEVRFGQSTRIGRLV